MRRLIPGVTRQTETNTLRKVLVATLIGTVLGVTCSDSAANLVMSYTGVPFDIPQGVGPAGMVEAEFSFTGPIADGDVLTLADVNSWSMRAGGSPAFSDTSGAVAVGSWSFTFGEVAGDIVPVIWEFAAEQNYTGGVEPEQIGSTTARDTVEELFFSSVDFLVIDDLVFPNGGGAGSAVFSGTVTAGAWSVTAIPEPTAFLFGGLVAGLIGLSNLRRWAPLACRP